jgi:hypothetical protein
MCRGVQFESLSVAEILHVRCACQPGAFPRKRALFNSRDTSACAFDEALSEFQVKVGEHLRRNQACMER